MGLSLHGNFLWCPFTEWSESNIYLYKDETFMKKVFFLWDVTGPCFYFYCFLFIDFRERGERRETLICCFTYYLCIHLLIFVCALTGDWTHNLGALGLMHYNCATWPGPGPCFCELPNWIILFVVQLTDTELLNLGKCKLFPSNENF